MSNSDFAFDLETTLNQPPKATQRDPFGSKDTSAYFASEEGNQQLALLEHLSRYTNLLSVVQGPQGSGKSRFLMEFSRHQDDMTVISHVKAAVLMTAGQLLQAIYSGFTGHFAQPPNEATFGPLLKFSHDLSEKGQSALVLVDNAQELNTDAISMLLDMVSLATENQAVPHITLFSGHSLARSLDSFQRSRYEQLSYTLVLAPYSLEQTRAYLLHRVRTVGGGIHLPFDDKKIKQIHQGSGGYPGTINQLAQTIMGNGGKPVKEGGLFNVALGFPLVHMALLSVVMLGILVAVLFNGSKGSKSTVLVTDRTSNVIPLSPLSRQEQTRQEKLSQVLSPKRLSRQGQSSSETIARIDAMQRKIGQEGKIVLPPIPANLSQPEKSQSQPKIVTTVPSTAPTIARVVSPAPIRSEAPQIQPVSVAVVTEPAKLKTEKSDLKVSTDPFDKTQWWLEQKSKRYTLQLFGAYDRSKAKDFIRDQGSVAAFSYFKAKHKGKDWFVVVYGIYLSRSQAIAAVETLPKDIRNLNPWTRSAQGIQSDIKKAR